MNVSNILNLKTEDIPKGSTHFNDNDRRFWKRTSGGWWYVWKPKIEDWQPTSGNPYGFEHFCKLG